MDKLVDQSLRHVWFADDALLVVLPDGAAKLVIVHSRPVLPQTPESSYMSRVFNFKDALKGKRGIRDLNGLTVLLTGCSSFFIHW